MLGRDIESGIPTTSMLDDRVKRLVGDAVPESGAAPVMPSPPPFRSFESRPTLPHQTPGVGYESGRDSRAR